MRALKGFFQLSAADGGWRVAIVDAADELNASAANALLKILEEPPPRAVLLLVSHRPAALLPTLRSRCRELRCAPLAAADLAAALAAAGAPPEPGSETRSSRRWPAARSASRSTSPHDGGVARYAEIVDLLRHSPPLDRRAAIALAEAASGRDAAARYEMILELTGIALGPPRARRRRRRGHPGLRRRGRADGRASPRPRPRPGSGPSWCRGSPRAASTPAPSTLTPPR